MARVASLRRQLLLGLLVPLLPILLISVAAAYFAAYHFANLAYDRALLRAVRSLADQVMVVQGQVAVDLPQVALDMLEYDKDDWRYHKVSGPDGEFITGERDLPPPPQPGKPGQHSYYNVEFDGETVRIAAYLLPLKGPGLSGTVLVQVAETLSKRNAMAEEIMVTMLAPLLLVVGAIVFLIWKGVGRGLAPLEALRSEIGSRSYQDLSPLNAAGAPGEVQSMLQAINDLMQRLEQSIAQQQQFIADASHQLRTPLAGLKTQAELALREPDADKMRHALQQILAGGERLSHLANQLLLLARVEPSGHSHENDPPLELDSMVRTRMADWVGMALAKGIDLGFEAPPQPVRVQGDPLLLGELLGNLLDNAIRYTPRGGKVTAGVAEHGSRAVLSVEDDGPGIPEQERALVFRRFHRVLGSGEEGCGLGLAIVHEIAQRHGAAVEITAAAAARGCCVRVTFPPLRR